MSTTGMIKKAASANAAATTAPKPMGPGALMRQTLSSAALKEQFEAVLKDKASGFIAGVIDLYASDNYLAQCNPSAVALECLKAAVLDLPINKQLGFAWVIPYKEKGVQTPHFQLGYKGYIQLAQRTGAYKFLNADKVYEGEFVAKNKLTGEIDLSGTATSDNVVGYFAYMETISGFCKTVYMTRDEVVKHAQKHSQSYKSGSKIWREFFDEMAMKTCLRLLISKWGVMSVSMVKAHELDEVTQQADAAITGTEIPVDTATGEVIEAEYSTVEDEYSDDLEREEQEAREMAMADMMYMQNEQ